MGLQKIANKSQTATFLLMFILSFPVLMQASESRQDGRTCAPALNVEGSDLNVPWFDRLRQNREIADINLKFYQEQLSAPESKRLLKDPRFLSFARGSSGNPINKQLHDRIQGLKESLERYQRQEVALRKLHELNKSFIKKQKKFFQTSNPQESEFYQYANELIQLSIDHLYFVLSGPLQEGGLWAHTGLMTSLESLIHFLRVHSETGVVEQAKIVRTKFLHSSEVMMRDLDLHSEFNLDKKELMGALSVLSYSYALPPRKISQVYNDTVSLLSEHPALKTPAIVFGILNLSFHASTEPRENVRNLVNIYKTFSRGGLLTSRSTRDPYFSLLFLDFISKHHLDVSNSLTQFEYFLKTIEQSRVQVARELKASLPKINLVSALTLYEISMSDFAGSRADLARKFQTYQAMHANYFGRSKSVTDLSKVIYFRILIRSPQTSFSEIYEYIQEDYRVARFSAEFALLPESRARMIESLILAKRLKSSIRDSRSIVLHQRLEGMEQSRDVEKQPQFFYLPLSRLDEVLTAMSCSMESDRNCFNQYALQNKFFNKSMFRSWVLDDVIDPVSYENIRKNKYASVH